MVKMLVLTVLGQNGDVIEFVYKAFNLTTVLAFYTTDLNISGTLSVDGDLP